MSIFDLFDTALDVGTTFDWISPVLSIAGDVAHGGGRTFFIDQGCGWTGGEIVNLLRRHGIKSWGRMIVNGRIMFTVRKSDADRARRLLADAGLV
jgi:hypothetical protein